MWGVPPEATPLGVLGLSPSLLLGASGLSPLPPFASRVVGMCEAFFAGPCSLFPNFFEFRLDSKLPVTPSSMDHAVASPY